MEGKSKNIVLIVVIAVLVSCCVTFFVTKGLSKGDECESKEKEAVKDVKDFKIPDKYEKKVETEISLNGKKHIITEGYYLGENPFEAYDSESDVVVDSGTKKVYKDVYLDGNEILNSLSAGISYNNIDGAVSEDKKINDDSIHYIKDVETQEEYLVYFNQYVANSYTIGNDKAYFFKENGSNIAEYVNKYGGQTVKVIEDSRFSEYNVELHPYSFFVLKSFECDKKGNISAVEYEIRKGEVKEISKIIYNESELDLAGAGC